MAPKLMGLGALFLVGFCARMVSGLLSSAHSQVAGASRLLSSSHNMCFASLNCHSVHSSGWHSLQRGKRPDNHIRSHRDGQWMLHMSDKKAPSPPPPAGMKGLYRRPSKAIENGGGFFIPGLEGDRVRIVSAVALLVALFVNHLGVIKESQSQATSEIISLFFSGFLFAQTAAPIIASSLGLSSNEDSALTDQLTLLSSDKGTVVPETAVLRLQRKVVAEIAASCEGVFFVGLYTPEDALVEFGPISMPASNKSVASLLWESLSCYLNERPTVQFVIIDSAKAAVNVFQDNLNQLPMFSGVSSGDIGNGGLQCDSVLYVDRNANRLWLLQSRLRGSFEDPQTRQWLRAMLNVPC